METGEQVTLRFKGVDFPSIQLNSKKPFKESENSNIKIDIQPRAFIPEDSTNLFKIIMDVELSSEDHFNLKLTAVGNFELSKENVSQEQIKSFINANSTAIMFPYVRAFISMLTSNTGNVTSAILLPTRFFKGDYLEEASK
jgi:preprotein translocase subunit SecB